jgi:hypothetical protein
MFAGYTRDLSVSEALRATFDPAKPCDLCRAVAVAKATEQKQAPPQAVRSAEKLLLAFHAPTQILPLKPRVEWPAPAKEMAPSRTEAVPVPPPRLPIA